QRGLGRPPWRRRRTAHGRLAELARVPRNAWLVWPHGYPRTLQCNDPLPRRPRPCLLRVSGRWSHRCAPHLVGSVRDNRPVVNTGPKHSTWSRGSKEAVLPHDPEDPTLARANAFPAQSRPGLSVSLAVERRFGQNVADLPKEVGVGVGRSGAPLLGRREG